MTTATNSKLRGRAISQRSRLSTRAKKIPSAATMISRDQPCVGIDSDADGPRVTALSDAVRGGGDVCRSRSLRSAAADIDVAIDVANIDRQMGHRLGTIDRHRDVALV